MSFRSVLTVLFLASLATIWTLWPRQYQRWVVGLTLKPSRWRRDPAERLFQRLYCGGFSSLIGMGFNSTHPTASSQRSGGLPDRRFTSLTTVVAHS
jgi:hypothetical protein